MPRLLSTGDTVTWIYEDENGVQSEWTDARYDQWEVDYAAKFTTSKEKALKLIDKYAGEIRSKYITVEPGQEMTYLEKAEQAADYVAAAYPVDTSNYPFIQAEIDATQKTKEQAADDILTQKSLWITLGSTIEKHRMSGKMQINQATTITEIESIYENIITLLDTV